MWKEIVLWLFVINLDIAFGAGIYEGRVVIPQWANIPPREWPNTGLMFWVYLTTVPLTLLTVVSLIAAWLTQGPMRPWYLAAVCIVIVERIATFSYFIPPMAAHEPWASRTHIGRLACSFEGIISLQGGRLTTACNGRARAWC